jgi:ABC-2 type transport system permease protein
MMLRAVMQKEFRQIVRDRRTLAVLLLVPVFLLVMFGYAISLDLKDAAIAVADYDHSPESRGLVEEFAHSRYFHLAGMVRSERDLDRLIETEKVKAALVIPRGFARAFERGEPAAVQILVDGTNGTTGSAALGYMQAIVADYGAGAAGSPAGQSASVPVALSYRPRVWFNPELESNLFLIPGLVAFILVITAVISTALSVVREKELGTMEQIAASPLRPLDLVVGKCIPYVFISAVIAASIFVASYLLFGVGVEGSILWLSAVTALFLLACLGLGIFISSIAESQQSAFLVAILATFLPSFLLSGFVFPIANMPAPIRAVTYLVPARYYLAALREIMLRGASIDAFWPDALLLLLFGALALGAGTLRLHRSMSA